MALWLREAAQRRQMFENLVSGSSHENDQGSGAAPSSLALAGFQGNAVNPAAAAPGSFGNTGGTGNAAGFQGNAAASSAAPASFNPAASSAAPATETDNTNGAIPQAGFTAPSNGNGSNVYTFATSGAAAPASGAGASFPGNGQPLGSKIGLYEYDPDL